MAARPRRARVAAAGVPRPALHHDLCVLDALAVLGLDRTDVGITNGAAGHHQVLKVGAHCIRRRGRRARVPPRARAPRPQPRDDLLRDLGREPPPPVRRRRRHRGPPATQRTSSTARTPQPKS
eukprot:TRINITY_DN4260_c0_g2_i1.p3 TRINITY_DN4260_c0_g2~~TRINITY_DN4260_c0_g2_i1.p3  ORF type:complete len:123 (-),score=19.02 TRINITY_DN4260_c0_g2_i1:46-414(-)